jgi:hypothetical protein
VRPSIVLAALLVSSPAWSEPQAAVAAPAASAGNPDEMICRNVAELGSRLSRHRECRTRAQWDEVRRTTRQGVEHAQSLLNPRQLN